MESFLMAAAVTLVLVFLVINIIQKKPRAWLPFIAALVIAGLVYLLQLTGWLEGAVSFTLGDEVFVIFRFASHPYSRLAAFGLIVAGSLSVLFGLEQSRPLDQTLSLCAIACAVGATYAADFITLFFFWEMVTVFTAGLILCNTKHVDTCPVFPLGFRYLVVHLTGGVLLLFGILQHFQQTGSFLVAAPEAGLVFFLLGIGIKAVFIPFHVWVLWGYPNASLFSSVVLAGLSTKIGVYAVARILPPMDLIVMMGASMAVIGVISALAQKNLRKLLSYHIISQVGYMVAGVGLGISLSIDGGLLHMINHMLYKSLLFMCAGTVLHCIGTEEMDELTGAGQKDRQGMDAEKKPVWKLVPFAFIGALIGSLAISGAPPFNGYVSKYTLKSAFEGIEPAAFMLTMASIGTALSFSKFVFYGFFKARGSMRRSPSLSMKVGVFAVSSLCLALGIRPELISSLLPYESLLNVYTVEGIRYAYLLIFTGAATFALLSKILVSQKLISIFERFSVENIIFQKVAPTCTRAGNQIWCALEKKGEPAYERMAEYLIVTLVVFLVAVVFLYSGRMP